MKPGFRVPAKPSKKDAIGALQTEVQNLSMATQLSQMMIKQMMQNTQKLSQDLGSALGQLLELQYKFNAVRKHLNLDSAALDAIANEQRLVDFNDAAAKADVSENLEVGAVVSENSTVVLTSTAVDQSGTDVGIFRSRIKVSESGVPALNQELLGKKVGDKVNVTLNGNNHEIEILSIRDEKLTTTSPEEASH